MGWEDWGYQSGLLAEVRVGEFHIVPLNLLSRLLAEFALLIGVRVALGEIDDHRGAGGFFVVVSGAHARMIPRRTLAVSNYSKKLHQPP